MAILCTLTMITGILGWNVVSSSKKSEAKDRQRVRKGLERQLVRLIRLETKILPASTWSTILWRPVPIRSNPNRQDIRVLHYYVFETLFVLASDGSGIEPQIATEYVQADENGYVWDCER